MNAYAQMSIEDLTTWKDHFNSTGHYGDVVAIEQHLMGRRAARDAILDLAEQLDAEGWVVVPKATLEMADTALCDWVNVYAPEECREDRVKEARSRIGRHGTLGYIADVLQAIRAAPLPASPSSAEG